LDLLHPLSFLGKVSKVRTDAGTPTAQPSGKTLKVYIIAANDAGQAAPSDTVTIVVP
jgi:hypothetical protein